MSSRPGPAEARRVMDQHMTEKDFQQQIIALAELCGWSWYHVPDSRRCPAGFPDLVLAHPNGQALVAEIKTARGRVSWEQGMWFRLLTGAGWRVYLWRPSNWSNGEIERVLRGGTGRE